MVSGLVLGEMGEITGDDDIQEEVRKKSNRHDGGVADLERVTDYAEEKEIQFNMSNAANLFGEKHEKATEARLAKQQELEKVQIRKEDVELIVNELLISRTVAEQTLREHHGDVVAALEELTD